MKTIPVIATARSRLHADVMLIRLRRAAVSIDAVSAFFPQALFPNSVACWLRRGQLTPLRLGGESFLATGPLRRELRRSDRDNFSPAAIFRRSEFDAITAQRLEESLRQGHMLVCVHAADEDEVAIAWHVFKHAEAESIALPSPAPHPAPAMVMPALFLPSFDAAIPA